MQSQLRSLLLFVSICGVLFVVLTVQTVPFLPTILHWPFDALRQHRMTLNTKVSVYDITLVQDPGDDLYQTYLVIKKDDQEGLSYLMIDIDDNKIRSPNLISKDGVVYFCDGTNVATSIARVDANTLTVVAGLTGERQLRDLKFDGKWVYGGGDPSKLYAS